MGWTNRLISVDIFTASYRVVGKVQVGKQWVVGNAQR